ncbi:MAG: SRPBCC domain-containing protein [Deltaproteobacteria bacterium]|nr:MAG: SRPBCC domain-containing protein [Deltaproteobacteria bacterium]
MTLLEHTLETSATPAQVWAVLEEVTSWHAWNTLTAEAPDGLVVGGRLSLGIRIGGLTIPAKAVFTQVEPERFLVWKGGVPGLFRAVHGFDLSPTESGGTRIRHHETFGGALHRPMLLALGQRQRDIYGKINARLAKTAESR